MFRGLMSLALLGLVGAASASAEVMLRQWQLSPASFAESARDFWLSRPLAGDTAVNFEFDRDNSLLREFDTNGDGVADELRLTGRMSGQGAAFDVQLVLRRLAANEVYPQFVEGSTGDWVIDGARSSLAGVAGSSVEGVQRQIYSSPSQAFTFQSFGSGLMLSHAGEFGMRLDGSQRQAGLALVVVPSPEASLLAIGGLFVLIGLRRSF